MTKPLTPIKNDENSGFTLVELMIATTVFAFVLLLITVAVMQIGRTYFKGITSTRTQEVARSVMDEISQSIQFGSGTPVHSPGLICAGGKLFSYDLDRMVTDTPEVHALRLKEVPDCSAVSRDMSSGRELLGPRMRLSELSVTPLSGNLYRVNVAVVSGDNSVLTSDRKQCALHGASVQFCAVSELTTVVQKRTR